jgi:CDP-4-dehydro-6-deoxyglucose reductase, E3
MRTAKVLENKMLTHDVFQLKLETEDLFEFQSGQFITIKIDDQVPPCFRAYSIASAPIANSKGCEVCIKVVEDGRGSNWLQAMKEGSEFNFIGPTGKFLFLGEKEKVLFVATGTGVAPFRSMIESLLSSGSEKEIELLFGVRHIKDLFYVDLFEKLVEEHPNFKVRFTLSRPEDESWEGLRGRVTEHLDDTDVQNTEVYICGLKDMIEQVIDILEKAGMPREQIHEEKYD